MTPSARVSAAIEVLAEILAARRPAADALKQWGIAHRFAGSGDRAAIAGLVFDALRRRASSAWIMQSDTPRAIVLGMLMRERGYDLDALARTCDGARFSPAPLSEAETRAVQSGSLADAPPFVRGDYPEWLDPLLARVFGDLRAEEGEALAARAPLDLRVNTLKAEAAQVVAALADYSPAPGAWASTALRIELDAEAKSPALHAEPAFMKGRFEIQDEGSQLAAVFTAAKAGEQVVDLCAGAGGKTLAMAAVMGNRGQIYASDMDKRRLAPIYARVERAGARNVQVRTPSTSRDVFADLVGRADLVMVDAPCTGTGAWRRNPDAKWRVRPGALEQRTAEQRRVLDEAARLVRPGGRIAYVTCSVLQEENDDQVSAFLARHPAFKPLEPRALAAPLQDRADRFLATAVVSSHGVLMTPRRTGTDGFFVALLVCRE